MITHLTAGVEPFRLYLKLVRLSLMSRTQYRADFIIGVIGVIVWNSANLGLISILVNSFAQLKGWTFWQLVFLYCIWVLIHGIYSIFFSHIEQMEDYLIEGTFDQFLLRPVNPLIQVFGRQFQYLGLTDMVIGFTGISLAYGSLNLRWNSDKWGFLILTIVSGTFIELALNMLIASTAFWTGRSRAGYFMLSQFSGLVQQYPVDIFGNVFRVIVTGLIPVAFLNYYPSLFLLDKLDHTHPGWWLSYASPAVALILLGFNLKIWQLALRRYTSTGS